MTSSPTSDALPVFADVLAAADRIARHTVATPLLESPWLNERAGCRVLVKAECLQRTGSFKVRGALNRLCRLDATQRRRGVVAFSSGNHAQGVAAAARLLGISATIVMPSDAPRLKRENTKGYGADVVTYDRGSEDRAAIAAEIANRQRAVLVPPFDDPDIIAGQGTIGLEIARQAAEMDASVARVLVPCSGGGLSSGIATAFAVLQPDCRIHPVEPEGFDDTARSLATGRRLRNEGFESGFCDALLSPMPGALTFEILRQRRASGLVVSDATVRMAMAVAFERLKIVLEPGGAAALAALLAHGSGFGGETIVVVASGGNVDRDVFREALAGAGH